MKTQLEGNGRRVGGSVDKRVCLPLAGDVILLGFLLNDYLHSKLVQSPHPLRRPSYRPFQIFAAAHLIPRTCCSLRFPNCSLVSTSPVWRNEKQRQSTSWVRTARRGRSLQLDPQLLDSKDSSKRFLHQWMAGEFERETRQNRPGQVVLRERNPRRIFTLQV